MARALAFALVLTLVAAVPAAATFPGRNGDLLVTQTTGGKYFDQRLRILRIHPRSGAVRELPICTYPDYIDYGTPPNCVSAGPPAASPDGREVAVISLDEEEETGQRKWGLRVLSLEDGAQTHTPVSPAIPLLPGFNPVSRWGPDGSELLVVQAQSPATEPYADEPEPGRATLLGRDGAERRFVAGDVSSPDVALDGRVAFSRYGEIYIQGPGEDARRLTWRGGDQPSWSPGGRFIAFTRSGHVFVVRAEGGRARRVARGTEPVWSPDGRRIAFFRNISEDSVSRVYLYAATRRTGRVRRVSSHDLGVLGYESPTGGPDWQPLPPSP